MALKLGKCRLCLKLGDFYSIFAVDDSLQLAEMVMDCTSVKIYEGDGLPDKICSECVQKLSSAYIFKQQCERSDQELRRNYVPPPGFNIKTSPPTRQSSDSAISTHTDTSKETKPSFSVEKSTPVSRKRKLSRESFDNVSVSSRSHESQGSVKKDVQNLKKSEKRQKISNYDEDFEYEDNNSISQHSAESDSDSSIIQKSSHKCKQCPKQFKSSTSLRSHMRVHFNKSNLNKSNNLSENVVIDLPERKTQEKKIEDALDVDDRINCGKCGKKFKLKIMLKRHLEVCGKTPETSPQKELLVSLEPLNNLQTTDKIDCQLCSTKFKTVENLEKHMRVCHAAVLNHNDLNSSQQKLKPNTDPALVSVPCLYCKKPFNDYFVHKAHFDSCLQKIELQSYDCPVCDKSLTKKCYYYLHLKNVHFWPMTNDSLNSLEISESPKEELKCRMCHKMLPTQQQLITHLAEHVSNISDKDNTMEDNDNKESSILDDSVSVRSDSSYSKASSSAILMCPFCSKQFKYRKAMESHVKTHVVQGESKIKAEPPDKNISGLSQSYCESDSDSSQEEDLTCDICEKMFSYKRLLEHHKRTKHNMSSGTKRAKILLKDCPVRCLICDIEMKVSDINEHNQTHISKNIKPKNLYTCSDCSEKFKSCSNLANHIKLVHRLKQQGPKAEPQFEGADLADFCEVVVTKTEPLESIQSHNDLGEVPGNDGNELQVDMTGFTCPICNKQMKTLISLKRHMNWHSNVGNNIEKMTECFICNEKFRFQSHYKLHMREHYKDTNLDPKFLTCSICNRKSKHLRAAQAHMNFHKQTRFKNKDYQCSICKRIFEHRKVYLSHMAIHFKRGDSIQNVVVGDSPGVKTNLEGNFICDLCGKICDSKNSLKCHTTWHKSKSSLFGARHDCYICQMQFTNKRRLDLHIREHFEDDNGPYKCNICGKGYIEEDYYRRHVKGHNFDHNSHQKRIEKLRKDKVKCPICNRYYPDLGKLIRHLRRTHPESKMIKQDPDAPPSNYFSCKLCAKVFLNERRLRLHEEAHLRKPTFFKCKFCSKKTTSLKIHNIHIKSHLYQKHLDDPLKCPHCDEKFTKGLLLHRHLMDAHDIRETWIAERTEESLDEPLKEFQCSVCLKVLANRGNFERHIDYHNSLRCNYCFDYFSTLRFLEGHLMFNCEKKKLLGETEVYMKKIKCHICYKAFYLQVKLDCHLYTQHGIKSCREASTSKKDAVCDFCFRVFENEDAVINHKVYHRTIGYFGCIYCTRKFNTITSYNKHKNHHLSQLNTDNPTKCEHCDETFVAFREMIYHMRDVHGDNKEWIVTPKESIEEKCNICNKVFYNVQRHIMYHEENRCKKCGEYFFSRIDFDNHLCAIESDEEVGNNEIDVPPAYEECRFCFKQITRKNSKQLHDNLHKVSSAISCRFCTHKFKTLDAFNIHAFSHRSRKYTNKPLKCRDCGEKFTKYGPFMKHLRNVHHSKKKVHYRAVVKPEACVVCGDEFPNLHNHYRAHLQNQCQLCQKYFISSKLFSNHECDKEDSDPSKVFTCDKNLQDLINSYVPKDEKDDEKYYGYTDNEEEEEDDFVTPKFELIQNDDSQNSAESANIFQSPVISDVLSLHEKLDDRSKNEDEDCAVDSMDIVNTCPITITID